MVYCTKCGTKNEEDSAFCVQCQQPLGGQHTERRERKRGEDECFGLPHGGIIFGLIIGIIIILVGVTSLAGIDLEFWPIIIVIFGLLIAGGAIYSLTQKR